MQTFSITQFSGDTRYGPAVARVRVLETRLLPKRAFVRMAESPNWEAMVDELRGTTYAEPLAHVRRPDHLKAAFAQIEKHRCRLIRKLEPRLFDALITWGDFNALKIVLKEQLTTLPQRAACDDGDGPILERIRDLVETNRSLPKPLERARATAVADYERHGSLFRLDVVVDRTFQEHVRDALEDYDVPFLRYLARYWIDLSNVSMALRWRAWRAPPHTAAGRPARIDTQLLTPGGFVKPDTAAALAEEPREKLAALLRYTPYGDLFAEAMEAYQRDGTLWLLERLSDEFLSAFCRLTYYTPFGVEPLVAFVWFSLQENKNLATVATAKAAALRPDVVIPRLRGGYHA